MSAGQVSNFSVIALSQKANAINLKYVFSFKTVPRVPVGSTLSVVLPAAYPTLSARVPKGSCTCSLKKSVFEVYSTGVRITGLDALLANSVVNVIIMGINNPPQSGAAEGFRVIFTNSANKPVIDHHISFLQTILPADAPQPLTFTFVPSTVSAQMSSIYVLTTSSPAIFFKGTVVTLTLPADFSMPSGVHCTNLQTITAYQSCRVGNHNSVVMVTSDDSGSSANSGRDSKL